MNHGVLSIRLAEAHEAQRRGHDVSDQINEIIKQFEQERE